MYLAILLALLLPSFVSSFVYQQQYYNQLSMTSINRDSLKFDTNQIKNCHKTAQKARNGLLHCNDDNKFQAKVCAVCDTFIKFNDEWPISVGLLLSSQVKQCLSVSTEEWDDLEVLEEDRAVIEQHYTQKCFQQKTSCSYRLNQLMLSPGSYKIEKTKRKPKLKM